MELNVVEHVAVDMRGRVIPRGTAVALCLPLGIWGLPD